MQPVAPANSAHAPPARVLAYEVPDPALLRRPARLARGLAAAAAIPAAVSPFVPFTYGVSPLDAVQYAGAWGMDLTLGLIALPFFLGIVIFLQRLRLIIRAPASRGEGWMILVLSLISTLGTIGLVAYYFYEVSLNGGWDWAPAACCAAALSIVAGGAWLIIMSRRYLQLHGCAIAAAQAAYLANAVLCLIAYMEHRQLGWWLTAVAGGIIAVEAVLLVRNSESQQLRRSAFES